MSKSLSSLQSLKDSLAQSCARAGDHSHTVTAGSRGCPTPAWLCTRETFSFQVEISAPYFPGTLRARPTCPCCVGVNVALAAARASPWCWPGHGCDPKTPHSLSRASCCWRLVSGSSVDTCLGTGMRASMCLCCREHPAAQRPLWNWSFWAGQLLTQPWVNYGPRAGFGLSEPKERAAPFYVMMFTVNLY